MPKTPDQLLRTMPYKDYLRTPEWGILRSAAVQRADCRCQVCNENERQLEVHHRTYERRGAEEPMDLVVLCESCHALFHGKERQEKGVSKAEQADVSEKQCSGCGKITGYPKRKLCPMCLSKKYKRRRRRVAVYSG